VEDYARRFLRSLIKVNETDKLSDNAFKALESPLNFSNANKTWQDIFDFVKDFYQQYEDYPSFRDVKATFEDHKDLEALNELPVIAKQAAETGSSFVHLIDKNMEEVNKRGLADVLHMSVEINLQKKKVNGKWLEGPKDAINFLMQNTEPFFYTKTHEKTSSEMSEAVEGALTRLETARESPLASYGVLSGFRPVDIALRGIKRKELMLVAGSVGECKTTFSLNYAYNACVFGGYNVVFVTLEMSKENIEDILFCIHANNPELQPGKKGDDRIIINFDDVKDGQLSKRQYAFYKNAVKDWGTRGKMRGVDPKYGSFTIWEPNQDLTPTLLRSKLDALHKQSPIHLLVVDYPALMTSEISKPGTSETAVLNDIMKKMKRLALTFNNGEGLAIICPFQINRDGKKDAVKKTESDKNPADFGQIEKPIYSTYNLSYANEAERSADYVMYTYLNHDLRQRGEIHVGCIKNRHGNIFPPFLAQTNLGARHIYYNPPEESTEIGKVEEIEL
jgi:replicative DNA helicase